MTMKSKAVVLAGGKGTRLRPLTVSFPKPLVPLGDKPILEILLLRLKSFGITDITISTGYLSQLITSLCNDGSGYGVNIDYVHEDEPLGTAGALSLIEDLTDNFLVMNGDLLTTLNFSAMMDFHVAQDADVTIGVYSREIKIDFGVVETDGDQFVGFKEKPTLYHDVSMGVNILSKRVTEYVAKNTYLDMPDLILKVHENGGKVCCYKEDCYWLDIGRMDDYAQAQQDYEENREKFLSGEL